MASIQGVYVALFGRPADPTGLSYFNGVTSNGADLTAIGDLASTAEYKARFKDMNNAQIVTAIYQSLFNRDPEAAGLNFFVDALNKGTLSINNIAIAILDGAQGTDKTIVDTKVAAADAFTAALDTPTEIASYMGTTAATAGINFLKGISTTAPTAAAVDAAVKGVVDTSNAGNTLDITAGATENLVVGTATTNTTDKNDTITADSTATATANGNDDDWNFADDKMDGGFGKDTFLVSIDGPATVIADGLKSIESLMIKSVDDTGALDVALAKDTTEIWNNASTNDLAVTNIAMGTSVGVSGTVTAGKTTSFGFAKDTGTSDSAKLVLDGATAAGGVSIANIETVEVNNTGTSAVALDLAGAKAVTITGSGSLTTTHAANAVTETVDASGSTGSVDLTLVNLNALKSVVGTAKGDKITVDADSAANDIAVDGGAGADLLTVGNGAASSAHTITLTGGADADKFVISETDTVNDITSAATLAKSLVTIADFNKAEDVIDVAAAFGTKGTLDQFEVASIAGQADLKAAASTAATSVGTGESAVFVWQGDTYIFNDTAADGVLTNGDALIKITGVSDLADLTAANFLI